jgi:hypothetical protein
MAGDGELLLEALRREIEDLPERCPGYHRAVLDTLVDIVTLEREHRAARIPIVQKMKEKTEALAKFVELKEEAT